MLENPCLAVYVDKRRANLHDGNCGYLDLHSQFPFFPMAGCFPSSGRFFFIFLRSPLDIRAFSHHNIAKKYLFLISTFGTKECLDGGYTVCGNARIRARPDAEASGERDPENADRPGIGRRGPGQLRDGPAGDEGTGDGGIHPADPWFRHLS
ncbi:hypothetical protein SDC9_184442 [bioreactor metagenome]|uniref:Uncharacterized protein n=1 Tax=bioreactor metagenome TaxID=1076179 RepID=A0A645HDY1_9ZZZZ